MAYDLFVSYAEADRAWVEGYLLEALQRAGVHYHSEDAFALGVPRLLAFERAVQDSQRTLLILSPAYLASSFSQFIDLLGQTYGLETATWPVIPLILHPLKLPPRLAILNSLDASTSHSWPTVLDRLCRELHRRVPIAVPPPVCPYPGMTPFGEADSDRFFGREREITEMINRMRRHRLLIVIGPSGSGKSSLVLAGLLPALRKNSVFGAGEWLVRTMRPGDSPQDLLEHTLGDMRGVLEIGDSSGTLVLEKGFRLLLIVDQFEEIFTLAGQQSVSFQRNLLRIAQTPDCYVVLTLRADFYADLMTAPIWPSIREHRFEIAPMDEASLKVAIVRPAEDAGVFVEAALVERLVADGAGEPGVLPLIQETLVMLWERLERRFLPVHAYDSLTPLGSRSGSNALAGATGLQVAMARQADSALGVLDPAQQSIARQIFLRLIAFGEGRADTRRQLPVKALRSAARGEPQLFEPTLRHLADARLLTLSGEEHDIDRKVDIAHEALIAGWPTLQGWLSGRREIELTRRRLDDKVYEWVRLGRGDGGLLDAIELVEAERWLESSDAADAGYDSTLPELVALSRAAIERVENENEQARQHALAHAQALAEEQRQRAEEQARSAVRLRRVLAGLALMLILAIGSSVFAFEQQRQAVASADLASMRQAQALTSAALAAEKAAEAERRAQEASDAQRTAQAEANARASAVADQSTAIALQSTAKSEADRNARIASTREADALAAQRDAQAERDAKATEIALKSTAQVGALASAKLAATNEANAQQSAARAATNEAIARGAERRALDANASQATEVAIRTIAEAQANANAQLAATRAAEARRAELQAQANAGAARAAQATALAERDRARQQSNIALSRQVAAQALYYQNKQIDLALLLSVESNNIANTRESRSALLSGLTLLPYLTRLLYASLNSAHGVAFDSNDAVAFDQSGTHLILVDREAIRLWDLGSAQGSRTDGVKQAPLDTGYGSKLINSDGTRLSAIVCIAFDFGCSGKHVVWNLASNPPISTTLVTETADLSWRQAFSAAGDTLAVSGNGKTWIWNLAGIQPPQPEILSTSSHGLALNSDGSRLAMVDSWNALRLWDLQASPPISTTILEQLPPRAEAQLAFSPDNTQLAVAVHCEGFISSCTRRDARLWDLTATPPSSTVLTGTEQVVYTLAFSPDNTKVAGITAAGELLIWDLTKKQPGISRFRYLLPANYPHWTSSIAFSSDGQMLASTQNDGSIGLWNFTNDPLARSSLKIDKASRYSLSEDGSKLAASYCISSNCAHMQVAQWELAQGRPISSTLIPDVSENIYSIALSSDGSHLAIGQGKSQIQLWNLKTNPPTVSTLQIDAGPNGFGYSVEALAFSPDGLRLAAGVGNHLQVWDVRTGSPIGGLLKSDQPVIKTIAFGPDGTKLATLGCFRGDSCSFPDISLWDLRVAPPQRVTLKEIDVADVLALSPTGKILAIASSGKVQLWDVARVERIGELSVGQRANATALAFSRDGTILAVGYNYGAGNAGMDSILLWDVATNLPIGGELPSTFGNLGYIAFGVDDTILTSVSKEGLVRWLDLDPGNWRSKACGIVGRNFTQPEWAQFFGSEPYRKTCPNLP